MATRDDRSHDAELFGSHSRRPEVSSSCSSTLWTRWNLLIDEADRSHQFTATPYSNLWLEIPPDTRVLAVVTRWRRWSSLTQVYLSNFIHQPPEKLVFCACSTVEVFDWSGSVCVDPPAAGFGSLATGPEPAALLLVVPEKDILKS